MFFSCCVKHMVVLVWTGPSEDTWLEANSSRKTHAMCLVASPACSKPNHDFLPSNVKVTPQQLFCSCLGNGFIFISLRRPY